MFVAPERWRWLKRKSARRLRTRCWVKTLVSAISPGTEMLFYRGQVPEDMEIDSTIPALGGTASYPFKYGYAAVGEVVDAGPQVDKTWIGRGCLRFTLTKANF